MEALAQLLATRVAAEVPFLDRAVGLARLLIKPGLDGDTPLTLKLPVPVSFTAADCQRDERYLVPSDDTVGILFFEDGGSSRLVTSQYPASTQMRQTALRLLLWANPQRLDGELTEEALLGAVERALAIGQRFTSGSFLDVSVSYATLPAEASLFSRYSFEPVTPLLFPPYRLLGLALTVQYRLAGRCVAGVLPAVPTPGVLPIPAAPTLVAVQNLAVRIQLPMGFRDLSLIELELL